MYINICNSVDCVLYAWLIKFLYTLMLYVANHSVDN